jgi:hypothetical protein
MAERHTTTGLARQTSANKALDNFRESNTNEIYPRDPV